MVLQLFQIGIPQPVIVSFAAKRIMGRPTDVARLIWEIAMTNLKWGRVRIADQLATLDTGFTFWICHIPI